MEHRKLTWKNYERLERLWKDKTRTFTLKGCEAGEETRNRAIIITGRNSEDQHGNESLDRPRLSAAAAQR